MSLKSFIRKSFFGIDLPQEYLCVGKEDVQHPLSVLAADFPQSSSFDISEQHLFLGYKPLIIGIPAQKNSSLHSMLSSSKSIRLLFCKQESATDLVAFLKLQFSQQKDFDEQVLFIFIAEKGKHFFLSPLQQFMNRVKDIATRKSENNISLNGNLYDQVRIAYSFPRVISIVSLGDGTNFNMFPTDLNGSIGDHHYVISLRHEGMANEQVEAFKKICISTVSSSFYKEVYGLGRNHMQDTRHLDSFEIDDARSDQLNLPLPSQVLSYRELELTDALDIGIHRLHFFRIISQKVFRTQSTLAHLHRYYATWERKQGHAIRYLIR
ncbi:MAG: hypothetical protein ACHQD9_01560 [Chitinophagales bacterium]